MLHTIPDVLPELTPGWKAAPQTWRTPKMPPRRPQTSQGRSVREPTAFITQIPEPLAFASSAPTGRFEQSYSRPPSRQAPTPTVVAKQPHSRSRSERRQSFVLPGKPKTTPTWGESDTPYSAYHNAHVQQQANTGDASTGFGDKLRVVAAEYEAKRVWDTVGWTRAAKHQKALDMLVPGSPRTNLARAAESTFVDSLQRNAQQSTKSKELEMDHLHNKDQPAATAKAWGKVRGRVDALKHRNDEMFLAFVGQNTANREHKRVAEDAPNMHDNLLGVVQLAQGRHQKTQREGAVFSEIRLAKEKVKEMKRQRAAVITRLTADSSDSDDDGTCAKQTDSKDENKIRESFFQVARQVHTLPPVYGPNGDLPPEVVDSPQFQFAAAMLQSDLNPTPLPLRISNRSVDFQKCHLGSDAMMALSKFLRAEGTGDKTARYRKIELDGNEIDGNTCDALLKALSMQDAITKLDLSQNDIGHIGAAAVGDFIQGQPKMRLLILSNNQLGQAPSAIAALCEGAVYCESLEVLNLSKNKIAEECTTSLAEMLEDSTCLLQNLDLSYNSIRTMGAQRLLNGISASRSLVNINLSWNGLTNTDALALAEAVLKGLPVLEKIDLSHNHIGDRGVILLADSLEQKLSSSVLTNIRLSGNKIGALGMQALHHLSIRAPREIAVSKCNAAGVDPALIETNDPAGEYILDLSDPYQACVARRLITQAKADLRFSDGQPAMVNTTIDSSSWEPSGTLPDSGILKFQYQRVRLPCPEAALSEQEFRGLLDFLTVAEHKYAACCNQLRQMPNSFLFTCAQVVKLYWTLVRRYGAESEACAVFLRQVFHRVCDGDFREFSLPEDEVREKTDIDPELANDHRAKALEIFECVDTNGDGVISKAEVKRYAQETEGRELAEMFEIQGKGWKHMWDRIDANDDGEVSKDEWASAYVATLLPNDDTATHEHERAVPEHQTKVMSQLLTWTSKFQAENPTGHYSINLSNPHEVSVLRRIFELSNELRRRRKAEGQWSRHQSEECNALRNTSLDGKRINYTVQTKLPLGRGVFVFDFVWDLVAPGNAQMMSEADFGVLFRRSIESGITYDVRLQMFLNASVEHWFGHDQLEKFLIVNQDRRLLSEICVILFSRVIKRRLYVSTVRSMCPRSVLVQLQKRLGIWNMFDPLNPVGPWVLNCANQDEQLMLWLLIQLTQEGPGYLSNIEVDGKAEKQCPSSWVQGNVPTSGTVTMNWDSTENSSDSFRVSEDAAPEEVAEAKKRKQDYLEETKAFYIKTTSMFLKTHRVLQRVDGLKFDVDIMDWVTGND